MLVAILGAPRVLGSYVNYSYLIWIPDEKGAGVCGSKREGTTEVGASEAPEDAAFWIGEC